MTYSILVPMVWYLIKQQTQQMTKGIQNGFSDVIKAIERHEKQDLRNTDLVREQVERLGGRMGNTKLSPEQAKMVLE